MELLIPGLILVAVMVYVSTRIKRSAAAAYEAELIETKFFSIKKPDGFIAVADPRRPLLFEAYSKEFGVGGRENDRLITATVRRTGEVGGLTNVGGEWHIGDDRVVEGRDGDDHVTRRAADGSAGELVLEIRSITEPEGESARKIEEMLRSFEVKAAETEVK
jgi:hypothetical protein